MNKFLKLFLVAYVLCAIGMLSVALVACSNGDDGGAPTGNPKNNGGNDNGNGGSNSALAVFTCNTGYDNRTLTFYNDSTFKAIVSDSNTPHAVGTYTLDSGNWENGTISMTATSGTKASTFTGTRTISEKKIIFSSKTYTLTGGTLKTSSESNESGTKQDDESGDSGNCAPATTTGAATFISTEFYFGNIKLQYYEDGKYLMTWALGSITTNKGKGTYTLTGTFENGTIHQHQTHSSDTLNSNWIEDVEDNNLVVTNGSFTVQLKDDDDVENVTFTKVNS